MMPHTYMVRSRTFGLPQTRPRIYMTAFRDDQIVNPEATFIQMDNLLFDVFPMLEIVKLKHVCRFTQSTSDTSAFGKLSFAYGVPGGSPHSKAFHTQSLMT